MKISLHVAELRGLLPLNRSFVNCKYRCDVKSFPVTALVVITSHPGGKTKIDQSVGFKLICNYVIKIDNINQPTSKIH